MMADADENSTKKSSGMSSVCTWKLHPPCVFGAITVVYWSQSCSSMRASRRKPAACITPRSGVAAVLVASTTRFTSASRARSSKEWQSRMISRTIRIYRGSFR